jgi:6-phosphogluconolactonase (cycloisomerase 2 family)
MKGPVKSYRIFSAVNVLFLLIAVFSGKAYADTKPKFVYVANSGSSSTGDTIATFSVTATAVCGGYPCASPISISGSFTVDLTKNTGISGTMYLTDTSDLKSSPVALPFNQQGSFAPDPNEYLFFRAPGGTEPVSYVELIFPFLTFPAKYSGGPLCAAGVSGCGVLSGAAIGGADMSATLFSETTGCCANGDTAVISSGTVTLTGISGGSQGSVGSVSGYAIDTTTGALSPLPGSPFAAGSGPSSVVVDPSNKFLYVANHLSNNVSAFAVDAKTGALTEIAGSPFAAGTAPIALAVDPLGKFVYVVNQNSNNLSVYTSNSQTGVLTPISGSPFPTAMSPNSVAVDPFGRFVYVPNYVGPQNYDYGLLGSNVSAYSVDRTADTLHTVPGSPFSVRPPVYATVDPSGKFFYVSVDSGSILFGINGYSIDGTTGALGEAVSYNMYPLGKPSATAFDPTGTFFYALDDRPLAGGYDIAGYTVNNTNGQLSGLPPPASTFAAGPYPLAMSIDPSGKFIYTPNFLGNNVSGYTIDAATGILTAVPGSPFAAGAAPISVAIVSSSSTPFKNFEAAVEIDEDRQTSFRVAGFFTLSEGSDGVDPLTEEVLLQVGSFTATIPGGSFKEIGKHTFKYDGSVNGADLKITIDAIERRPKGKHSHKKRVDQDEYLFTAEGKGKILAGVKNPVTVALTVGDNGGSKSLKADIDK